MNPRPVRPGVASFALLSIMVITAAWWALALWPAGAVEPEWLQRTRAVCFGSMPGGLPDAGGWIVLIGEPLGMLGVLAAVWGRALREDLRRLFADWRWRPVMLVIASAAVIGVVQTGRLVAYTAGLGQPVPIVLSGAPTVVDIDVTTHVLVDQHGRQTSLADLGGRSVLLTFAFGHCARALAALIARSRVTGLSGCPLAPSKITTSNSESRTGSRDNQRTTPSERSTTKKRTERIIRPQSAKSLRDRFISTLRLCLRAS